MQTQSDYRLLPIFLQSKLAILNPRNRDQKSFGHAIALFYHPSDWRKKSFKQTVETRFIEHGRSRKRCGFGAKMLSVAPPLRRHHSLSHILSYLNTVHVAYNTRHGIIL